MQLQQLTDQNLIFPNLAGSDSGSLLLEFSQRLVERGIVEEANELYRMLREREELGSTGIGDGVAIPHCKCKGIRQVVVAIGTSKNGIDFSAVDGGPVRLFFVVLSPEKDPASHLKSLAAISKWVKADNHVERILEASDPESIYELLGEAGDE